MADADSPIHRLWSELDTAVLEDLHRLIIHQSLDCQPLFGTRGDTPNHRLLAVYDAGSLVNGLFVGEGLGARIERDAGAALRRDESDGNWAAGFLGCEVFGRAVFEA